MSEEEKVSEGHLTVEHRSALALIRELHRLGVDRVVVGEVRVVFSPQGQGGTRGSSELSEAERAELQQLRDWYAGSVSDF